MKLQFLISRERIGPTQISRSELEKQDHKEFIRHESTSTVYTIKKRPTWVAFVVKYFEKILKELRFFCNSLTGYSRNTNTV
jgi:hypothetical protein